MAELGSGNGTEYPGTLDTYNTTVADSVDDIKADHMNDVNQAVVAIQNELGQDPAGSAATVVARIDAEHNADGTHAAVTATSAAVDNITIDGNTISSTDTAGNINLTPDTTGDLVLDGVNWPQADGSADTILKTNGSAQSSWATLASLYAGAWTNGAAITLSTGSPTSVSLVSGMTTPTQVEIYFIGMSTNAANQSPLIQIGGSGGLIATGYNGHGFANVAAHNTDANNTGFFLSSESDFDAASTWTGTVRLTHFGSNIWVLDAFSGSNAGGLLYGGNGNLNMGATTLDQISVTTSGGSATFDAGQAIVRWI